MNKMNGFVNALFGNVGHRLKVMAVVFFVLEILGGLIIGFAMIDNDALYFLVAALSGIAVAAFTSYPLYAFGQLVEDVHAIRTGGAGKVLVSDDLPDL